MTQAHTIDYHIIIVGGGIVGLSLASLLAQSSLKIAILENKDVSHHFNPSIHDIRVSAINRASENIFKNINAWKTIEQMRLSSYKRMQIWDEKATQEIFFDAAELGEPNLGHIIENQVMLAALENHLREHAHNVSFFPNFQAHEVQISSDHGYIQDQKGRKLKFQLIVGSDGKDSWLRKTMEIPIQQKNYTQTAVVAHVQTEKPHLATAYQRFLTNGPLAFLPLNDPHQCSIVWSTDPTKAAQLQEMNKEAFTAELAQAFDYRLGEITTISSVHTFPLYYQHAEHYFKKRVALIGDAAHTIHPMAGLGLNLGIVDAAALAEHILNSHQQQRDFGLEKTLRRYELQQKSNNTITLNMINFLKVFFGQRNTAIEQLKTVGFSVINTVSPAKTLLAKYALGIAGDLPASAK